jgi:hypothetical protein
MIQEHEEVMNRKQTPKPQASKIAQFCTIGFVAVGLVVYMAVASKLFPAPPGGGINFTRILGAAVVGGVCGGVGGAVGKLIESARR